MITRTVVVAIATIVSIVSIVSMVTGCGSVSSDSTPSSGGAYLPLSTGPDPSKPGSPLVCRDAGRAITLSVRGADGSATLVVDGVGGMIAKCVVTASSFDLEVATAAGSFRGSGSYTIVGATQQSTDASVAIQFGGTLYQTVATSCTIEFDRAQSGAGKLYGKLACPKLVNTSTSGTACAITAIDGAFFRFANCKSG